MISARIIYLYMGSNAWAGSVQQSIYERPHTMGFVSQKAEEK